MLAQLWNYAGSAVKRCWPNDENVSKHVSCIDSIPERITLTQYEPELTPAALQIPLGPRDRRGELSQESEPYSLRKTGTRLRQLE